MNFWNKSKTQSDIQSNTANSRPEDFGQKLEQIHFQARPDFREDLKARLMQNLAEQQPEVAGGKASLLPNLTQSRYLPSRTRLALGGIGLAALLVLLISVLSVGVVYRNPTASASVAAGGTGDNTPATPTPPVGPGSGTASAIQTALKSFFDPVAAAKMTGFAVSIPTYLPPGYKLNYAGVNAPVTAPAPAANGSTTLTPAGYTLRFIGTTQATASMAPIEIAQWQVPYKLGTAGEATLSQGNVQLLPGEAGIQTSQPITVSGSPALIIQGDQWQMQFSTAQPDGGAVTGPGQSGMSGAVILDPTSAPISGTTVITSALQVSGSGGVTATGPVISFTQVGISSTTNQGQAATSAGGVVVGFSAQDAQVKTLVWQQDSVFTVLTTPASLSDTELKQIAESLKSGG